MKPTGLSIGSKVIVSAFGMNGVLTITAIRQDPRQPGYIEFTLSEASKTISVHYEKNLDYWGSTPILL